MSIPARTRGRGGSDGVAAPHWGPHPIGGQKGVEPTVDHFCGYLHENNPAASTGVGKKMRRTFPRYPTGPQYLHIPGNPDATNFSQVPHGPPVLTYPR